MTIRFVADENFNRRIVTALHRRRPGIDIVRVQDVGLRTAGDLAVLDWSAHEGRLLVTHDAATVPDFAYFPLTRGLAMPGVIVVRPTVPIAVVVDDLALIDEVTEPGEWDRKVVYLPLRCVRHWPSYRLVSGR